MACLLACVAAAHAQTVVSLGMSGSVVEYDGFLTSTAATLSPAINFEKADFSFSSQGSWTVFESGNQILQGSAAAAWFAPSARRHTRMEWSGSLGASRYAREPTSAHALARGRFHFLRESEGGWLSATSGAVVDGSATTPFELSLGVWSVRESFALVGTLTGVWVEDRHHIDAAGAARWNRGRIEIEARLGARPFDDLARADDESVRVWGELAMQIHVASQLALALSGGSYPSDPLRRIRGARYITMGLKLDASGTKRSRTIPLPAVLAGVRERTNASGRLQPRLEIAGRGATRVVRIQAEAVTSVELMADFTDWQPVALTRAGATWETQLSIPEGVHRVNIRVDGGPWVVPAGAREERDEFGSVVGVIVIRK